MTEATKLLQGSDKDFAVVHSTLTDSKGTAKLMAGQANRFSKALLGEARRIDHTLDTLDRIKAQHDALVAALEAVVEASNNAVRAGQAIGRSSTTPPVIQLVEAALEQVKS
jgi:phage-related tail protein